MNVLMVAPYVTIKGHKEFMRNQTGFGYMVYDIAQAVSKTEDVDLFATDSRGDSFVLDNIQFLKRSWWSFFVHFYNCLPLSAVQNLMAIYPEMKRGTKLRLLYYLLFTGYLRHIIENKRYDVVHFHGCGFSIELGMQVCKRCGQKFLVTLHGLNSFSDSIKLEPAGKNYERAFLKRVTEGIIPTTVISTGMKKLIEKTYNAPNCRTITVVCNSFNFAKETGTGLNVKTKYSIPQNAKVLLYVGNISYNKNQEQMVKAFGLLPDEIQENTYVFFCGADLTKDGVLQSLIKKSKYKNHLILCGAVAKDEMPNYYLAANGVVLLSYAEGFGLSLVEGMHYGLPCAMFRDMDAFEDIFNPCCVVAIDSRDNQNVANGLKKLLESNWDEEQIRVYSQRFDQHSMAEHYIRAYNSLT